MPEKDEGMQRSAPEGRGARGSALPGRSYRGERREGLRGGESTSGLLATPHVPAVFLRPREFTGMSMSYENTNEKDRFFSRLASIPGVHPLPSIGDWILLEVPAPSDLARKVNRRLSPGVMSVPRGMDGAVRIHIGDPKDNEVLLRTLRELVA